MSELMGLKEQVDNLVQSLANVELEIAKLNTRIDQLTKLKYTQVTAKSLGKSGEDNSPTNQQPSQSIGFLVEVGGNFDNDDDPPKTLVRIVKDANNYVVKSKNGTYVEAGVLTFPVGWTISR